MTETREEIERKLAEIVCHDLSEHQAKWLCATIKSLLPARDVAEATVKMDSIAKEICQKPSEPGPPWISDFDAAQEVYDAALARYVAAEDKP